MATGKKSHRGSEEEKILMEQIRNGDIGALERLYDLYKSLLYGMIVSLLHKRNEADELLLAVFLSIREKAGTSDTQRGNIFSWIITLTHGKVIDYIRSKRDKTKNPEAIDERLVTLPVSTPDPFETTILTDRSLLVRKALEEMDEKQREIIDMAYFRGLTQSEVARHLDFPLDAVKASMRQGILSFINILKQHILGYGGEKVPDTLFMELGTGYVLNALEPEEKKEFEQMLSTADEKQVERYQQLHSAAANLAFATEHADPPESVKGQLLQVVKEEMEENRSADKITSTGSSEGFDKDVFAIAASFALLIVSLSLILYSMNLGRQLQEKNRQVTILEEEIGQIEGFLSDLESQELEIITLKGMEASPDGYGKIIWNWGKNQALLQVSNLPPVSDDKEYQLWIIRNNTPVSAGLFEVNEAGRDSFLKIEPIVSFGPSTDAITVTLEPEGGMPQPTGEMYLMGNITADQ